MEFKKPTNPKEGKMQKFSRGTGLLLMVLLIIAATPAIAMASDGENDENGKVILAGGAFIAILIVGSIILGRRSDGTHVQITRTDSKTPRSDIAKGSRSNQDR